MPEQLKTREEEPRKILVVEDDLDLGESIAKYLRLEGHLVTLVGTAGKCYVETDRTEFDLAILDLSLPDQDGLVLARYLRSNTRTTLLMLSARSTLDDRRMGYEAGAHLFVAKPVDFAELAGSVACLLGTRDASCREGTKPDGDVEEGGWQMRRTEGDLVSPSGERVRLTTKEWDLLELLAEHCNEVVPRERLVTAMGYAYDEYGQRSLESILYRLRRKTGPMGGTPLRTHHGSGYGFMAPLTVR